MIHEHYDSAKIANYPQAKFKQFLDTVGAVNVDAMFYSE